MPSAFALIILSITVVTMGAGRFCLRRSWATDPICSSVKPACADGVLAFGSDVLSRGADEVSIGTVTSPCLSEEAGLVATSRVFEGAVIAVKRGAGTDDWAIGEAPIFLPTGGLAVDIEFTGWNGKGCSTINDGGFSLRLEFRLERYKKRTAMVMTKASPPIVPPTIAAMGFLCEIVKVSLT